MIFNEMLIIKPENALVHVDGYFENNDTYVAPHYKEIQTEIHIIIFFLEIET
jgi:hypothetical protein